jgi:hypothetical protein
MMAFADRWAGHAQAYIRLSARGSARQPAPKANKTMLPGSGMTGSPEKFHTPLITIGR